MSSPNHCLSFPITFFKPSLSVEGVSFIPKWLRLNWGVQCAWGSSGPAPPPHPRSCCGLRGGGAGGGGAVGLSAAPTRGAGRHSWEAGALTWTPGLRARRGGRQPGGFLNPLPGPGPHFPSTAPPRERERESPSRTAQQLSPGGPRAPPPRALAKSPRARCPRVPPRQRPDSTHSPIPRPYTPGPPPRHHDEQQQLLGCLRPRPG